MSDKWQGVINLGNEVAHRQGVEGHNNYGRRDRRGQVSPRPDQEPRRAHLARVRARARAVAAALAPAPAARSRGSAVRSLA